MLGDKVEKETYSRSSPMYLLNSICPHCFLCSADPVDERAVCFGLAYLRGFFFGNQNCIHCVCGVFVGECMVE